MRTAYIFLLLINPFLLVAQNGPADCKDLHKGLFYHYSQMTNHHSVYIREDRIQKEINLETGDTALWKILWKDDCSYLLTYLSGDSIIDAVANGGRQKVLVKVRIATITPAYYVFQAIGTVGGKTTKESSDTLWLSDQPEKRAAKTVVDASFPGGLIAWRTYLDSLINSHQKQLKKSRKPGVCTVRFTVDTNGKVSGVEAISMRGTPIAKLAVDAIKNGPNWIPATVNGIPLKSLQTQPFIFQLKYD